MIGAYCFVELGCMLYGMNLGCCFMSQACDSDASPSRWLLGGMQWWSGGWPPWL